MPFCDISDATLTLQISPRIVAIIFKEYFFMTSIIQRNSHVKVFHTNDCWQNLRHLVHVTDVTDATPFPH